MPFATSSHRRSDRGASLESFTRSKYRGANDGDLDLDPARAQKSKWGAQTALRGEERSGGDNARGRSRNGGSAGTCQMRPNSVSFVQIALEDHGLDVFRIPNPPSLQAEGGLDRAEALRVLRREPPRKI